MQADTTFSTDLLTFGYVMPKSGDHPKCIFESYGGSKAPTLMPNATPTPQTGSLSLISEETSAPVVFLPVKFSDLAASALIDSGAMHNFLADSFLSKLPD